MFEIVDSARKKLVLYRFDGSFYIVEKTEYALLVVIVLFYFSRKYYDIVQVYLSKLQFHCY